MAVFAHPLRPSQAGHAARPDLPALFAQPGVQFALLLAVAVVLRAGTFGHPNIFLDEAFYFAAGIEMNQGAIPFVDVWDRKPYGHFALFAAIAAFSHDPIAYQLAATLFATATAFTLVRLAQPAAGPWGAIACGLAYLLYLPVFSGAGGQSPVFYNAFIAAAAWLVWNGRHGSVWQNGLAMLLAGIAITIKTSVIFDAAALGLVACWYAWQRLRHSPARVFERAFVWMLIGAAPSLAIAAGYWAAGYWDEFWQAMALSNLDKSYGFASSADRALTMATRLAPIALLAAASWTTWRGREVAPLLIVWVVAAVVGLVAIPNFYNHYALPLLMPLCVLAAPFFARVPLGAAALATLAAMSLWMSPPTGHEQTRKAKGAISAMSYAVEAHGGERGLLNYDGPMMLHAAAGTRPLTPLMFGPHLSHAPEADVSHLDTGDEVARVLALKPGVIVMAPEERHLPSNRETREMVLDYIAQNCREVAVIDMPMRVRVDPIAVYGDCASR